MKSFLYNVVPIFVSLWLLPKHAYAQIYTSNEESEMFLINQVTSSSFEMVLYPTPMKLDTSATAKVKKIIKNLLSVSSSNPNSAFSFNAIEILTEEVTFDEYYELKENPPSSFTDNSTQYTITSLLEFKVAVALRKPDTTLSPPSRFAIDNLVVRTFSQPSTKSTFVDLLTQTGDPFLIEVEDIVINLVQENPNEKSEGEWNAPLSSIDIILIIISSAIFLGVFFVMITYYHKDGYKDIWEGDSVKGKYNDDHRMDETCNVQSNDVEKSQVPLEKIMHIKGNIVEAGSLESSIDSQSQIVLSVENESPGVSYASSDSTSTRSHTSSSSSTCTSLTKKNIGKPTETCIEMTDGSIDSESMESKGRQDSKVSTMITNDLASKLLRLPGADVWPRKLKSNTIYSSVASAPTILEDITGKWKNDESKNKRAIKCNRSATSPECPKRNRKKKKASIISLRPTLENGFVLNGFILLGTTEEFHKSWLESQKKALEDVEEGSVDDVFQIAAQSNGDELEKKNATKYLPTQVSEWMNLVRVVNSPSETQSSLENLPMEPKVFTAKGSSSIDLSLEDSLAKSSVDLEVN